MARVYLVGAGPGAADLLTLRAVRVIESADVILYDALVQTEVLAYTKPASRLIDVGKRAGRKRFTQSEIDFLLVQFALEVEVVVRLKGGDPLVFGRAAEEIEALRQADIDFEIVPGVTAACSAAAAAKISLTDRRKSSEVVLTTATHSEDNQRLGLTNSERTHVIYMPGRDYLLVREQLREAGIADSTPCLVVSRISSAQEQVFSTTVAALESAPVLSAPTVLIIGEVARQEQKATPWSLRDVPSEVSVGAGVESGS